MEFKLIQKKARDSVALKFDNYFELKEKNSDADTLAISLNSAFSTSTNEATESFSSKSTYLLNKDCPRQKISDFRLFTLDWLIIT